MAKVLTTATKVTCFHGQDITFSSTATLRVGGSPVVRASEMVPPAATFKCTAQTKCATMVFQMSPTLRDDNQAVVVLTTLATNIGPCAISDDGHDLLQSD